MGEKRANGRLAPADASANSQPQPPDDIKQEQQSPAPDDFKSYSLDLLAVLEG